MKKIKINFGDSKKGIYESFSIYEAKNSLTGSLCYLLIPVESESICSTIVFPTITAAVDYLVNVREDISIK